MISLYDKVVAIYPELAEEKARRAFFDGTILLRNDSDGRGDYIAKWEHPTLARPTQEQLDSVGGA